MDRRELFKKVGVAAVAAAVVGVNKAANAEESVESCTSLKPIAVKKRRSFDMTTDEGRQAFNDILSYNVNGGKLDIIWGPDIDFTPLDPSDPAYQELDGISSHYPINMWEEDPTPLPTVANTPEYSEDFGVAQKIEINNETGEPDYWIGAPSPYVRYVSFSPEATLAIEYPNYHVKWVAFNVPNDKFTEVLDNWFITPIDKQKEWDWSKEVCGYKFKLSNYTEKRLL